MGEVNFPAPAPDIEGWLKSAQYLPPPLRDFHDQKDVFKAIHEMLDVAGNSYVGKVDFVTGQVYVIDFFLWFMARRGYTLQRSRARMPFRDLAEDVGAAKQKRDARYHAELQAWLSSGTKTPTPPEAGA